MKSLRMSRSTENRNARKEVSARGGGRGIDSAATLSADKEPVHGRRLRRALRDKRAHPNLVASPQDGALFRPIVPMALPPSTRAHLKARHS